MPLNKWQWVAAEKQIVSPRRAGPPSRALYLYLTERNWAKAWIEGGVVPMFPARKYLGARSGTQTPDEVVQKSFRGAPGGKAPAGIVFGNVPRSGFTPIYVSGSVVGCSFIDCDTGSDKMSNMTVSHYEEDAYVLCFSHTCDPSIAARMIDDSGRPKLICVEIVDPAALFAHIDAQLPERGEMGAIEYVDSDTRNHFTKSTKDIWQDEYRFLWRRTGSKEIGINIPHGAAKLAWQAPQ
jgi:hypothetical protein